MNMDKLREHLRKEGWLLGAMILCVIGCLLLGASHGTDGDQSNEVDSVLSSILGAGRTQVAIHYDADSLPCGAVVVSQGASDIAVRLRLTEAVSTLLGLDPSAVAVYPLEGGAP